MSDISWMAGARIAHRGSFDNEAVPENSLAAFRLSMDRGLPIELDIQVSADRVPVVLHDDDLTRLTGRAARCSKLPAAEIGRLLLLDSGDRIPTLRKVLELVSGRVPLLIELKTLGRRTGPMEEAVVACLKEYAGRVALQSFNPFTVAWLGRRAPRICRGQLSEGRHGVPLAFLSRPHFVAYRAADLPHPAVTRLRERGLPVLAWTVRSAAEEEAALRHADGVIFEGYYGEGPLSSG